MECEHNDKFRWSGCTLGNQIGVCNMSLIDNTLFGEVDKVAIAIERLKRFEPEEGYWVAIAGGKDSTVVYDLVHKSGVKADYHHSLTTLDAPQTIHFIREHQSDCVIEHPVKPLLVRMIEKGFPPLRQRRWCCEEYKERGGNGRFVVTGVRAAESAKRANRRMVETCYKDTTKQYLHVIIDWSNSDVWEYIRKNKLPYNPLYDKPYNFDRIGCVLCPMVRDIERQRYFFPKIYEAWHRAIVKCFNERKSKGQHLNQASGEDMWQWWLNRDAQVDNPDQTVLFE